MSGPAGGGAFILVADDNRDAADMTASLLEMIDGCEATAVYDGQAAVDLAARRRPDVAVLDLWMPILDGIEAARRIRTLYERDPPLILALTGVGRRADELDALDEQFDHVLAKPVDIDRLTAFVARHLRRVARPWDRGDDIAEMLFRIAKQAAPVVDAKTLALSCASKGPKAALAGDPTLLRRDVHRLLLAGVDLLRAGFLMVEVEVEALLDDESRLTVTVAGTGLLAPPDAVAEVARRLHVDVAETVGGSGAFSHRGHGVSPGSRATLQFACSASDGVLLRWTLQRSQLRLAAPEAGEAPSARGALAWIVDADDVRSSGLRRRLERLGWRVTTFADAGTAGEALRRRTGQQRRPALALLSVDSAATIEAAAHFRSLLDPRAQMVGMALLGSAELAHAASWRTGNGFDLRAHPLSPAEVETLTRRAGNDDDWAAGESGLAPLEAAATPFALIVDDNEVNRIVAAGLLEALGYRTGVASDGLDAIAHCRSAAPQLVLMDVDMPVLSGLDATRRLRELQQAGALPPFSIVAATARADAETCRQCTEAGMDGCLVKPLSLAALREQLRRA